MNHYWILILCALAVNPLNAASYAFPIGAKIEQSCIIAEVKIKELNPVPWARYPVDFTHFTTEVVEVFKGKSSACLKFSGNFPKWFTMKDHDSVIGLTFIVFLQDPNQDSRYRLLEWPMAMLPEMEEYVELRMVGATMVREVYTRDSYLEMLRAIE